MTTLNELNEPIHHDLIYMVFIVPLMQAQLCTLFCNEPCVVCRNSIVQVPLPSQSWLLGPPVAISCVQMADVQVWWPWGRRWTWEEGTDGAPLQPSSACPKNQHHLAPMDQVDVSRVSETIVHVVC